LALTLHLGDTVRLKKAHPCGSVDWEVTRLGADVGLLCLGCGRRTMLRRSRLEARLRELTARPSREVKS
jgi:hypothetical protein